VFLTKVFGENISELASISFYNAIHLLGNSMSLTLMILLETN
jgi:hypothetical protein